MQIDKIKQAKLSGSGVTLKLSKLQISKNGGFIGTLLAGLAGSLLHSLLGGKGLVLPGSKENRLVLPGSKGKGLVILEHKHLITFITFKICVRARYNSR